VPPRINQVRERKGENQTDEEEKKKKKEISQHNDFIKERKIEKEGTREGNYSNPEKGGLMKKKKKKGGHSVPGAGKGSKKKKPNTLPFCHIGGEKKGGRGERGPSAQISRGPLSPRKEGGKTGGWFWGEPPLGRGKKGLLRPS